MKKSTDDQRNLDSYATCVVNNYMERMLEFYSD